MNTRIRLALVQIVFATKDKEQSKSLRLHALVSIGERLLFPGCSNRASAVISGHSIKASAAVLTRFQSAFVNLFVAEDPSKAGMTLASESVDREIAA